MRITNSAWEAVPYKRYIKDGQKYWSIEGKQCNIVIEKRHTYCDRGNWLAKIFPRDQLMLDMDEQDGWPRYYMDLDRAKLEIDDWMKKRGQWV